jgi:hypothetical protein
MSLPNSGSFTLDQSDTAQPNIAALCVVGELFTTFSEMLVPHRFGLSAVCTIVKALTDSMSKP